MAEMWERRRALLVTIVVAVALAAGCTSVGRSSDGGESAGDPASTDGDGRGAGIGGDPEEAFVCPDDLTVVQPDLSDDQHHELQQCVAEEWLGLSGSPLPDFAALAQEKPLVRFYSMVTMLSVPGGVSPWAEACIVAAGYDELDDVDVAGLLVAPTVEELALADQPTVTRIYQRWNADCFSAPQSPESIYGADPLVNMAICGTRALSRERLQLLGNTDPAISAERDEMISDVDRQVGSCGGEAAQAAWAVIAGYSGPLGL